MEKLNINGIDYVPFSEVTSTKLSTEGLPYVIIRTYSAGVFAGYLKSQKGKEVKLLSARRLYYWDGAASLSQLSQEGVSKPHNCKFPCELPEIFLTEAIETIPTTEKAFISITSVPVWKQ